jgi:hypothetical protein
VEWFKVKASPSTAKKKKKLTMLDMLKNNMEEIEHLDHAQGIVFVDQING